MFLPRTLLCACLVGALAPTHGRAQHAAEGEPPSPERHQTEPDELADATAAELWDAADALPEVAAEDARRRLVVALVARGGEAARVGLASLASQPVGARRLRSLVVREVGDAALVPAALALLEDPDVEVRRDGIAFLAQVAGQVEPGLRSQALARVVREDPERDLRMLAWFGLGSLGTAAAVRELDQAFDVVPTEEQIIAARVMTLTPTAREVLCERVQRALRAEAGMAGRRLAPAVLAELLGGGYGQRLAELPAGGASLADRMPFVTGAHHHDQRVRNACGRALDRFVARGLELGRADDVDRVLAALLTEGGTRRDVWRRRAQLALRGAIDPRIALAAGAALEREAERSGTAFGEAGVLADRFEGALVAALGALASGEPEEAWKPLERAAELAAAGRGLAFDPRRRSLLRGASDDGGARTATGDDVYLRAALVEVLNALAHLAGGVAVDDPRVLAGLRAAHVELLRAQLVGIRYPVTLGRGETFDEVLFLQPWSPDVVLLGGGPRSLLAKGAGIPGRELLERLGRAGASIAPAEFPGFEPLPELAPELADPERDSVRRELLFRIASHWSRGDPRRAEVEGSALRHPSRAALLVAEALVAEGRPGEGRALAERMQRALDQNPTPVGFAKARVEVELERLIGASFTDDGQPERAEEVLEGVVERLVELESDAQANGRDPAPWRLERANVLVSLAVNANVKLRRPQRALDYFERAYELRQDDFMTVLLACYRARAGRDEEARRILAGAAVMPSTFYNLACTHALLGDSDEALDLLERDFRENHASRSSLERQQAWARGDPDLAALEGDPRFERLLELDFGALAGER